MKDRYRLGILIFQIIKFFFEIGERYVVTVILVVLAPLAFGMGGSKNTEDIFKGWCRMFGSMCVMMLMNVVFLKLLLSAMSTVPSGAGVFPWLIFVTAIVRVGRKIDDIVCRMGLNPAHTGSPLGHGFMSLPQMVANNAMRTVMQTASANHTHNSPASGNRNAGRGAPSAPSPGPSPAGGGSSPSGASGGTAGSAPASHATGAPAQSTPQSGQATQNPTAAPQPAATGNGQNAAPTRPPIGRGRTHTPPAQAASSGSGGATRSNFSGGNAAVSATSSAQAQADTPGAAQNSVPQSGKSAPLGVNTNTPQSRAAVGKDGKTIAGQPAGAQTHPSQSAPTAAANHAQAGTSGATRPPIQQGGNTTISQQGGVSANAQSTSDSGAAHPTTQGGASSPRSSASLAGTAPTPSGAQQHPTAQSGTTPPRSGVSSAGAAPTPSGAQQHPTAQSGTSSAIQRGGSVANVTDSRTETRAPSGAAIPAQTVVIQPPNRPPVGTP